MAKSTTKKSFPRRTTKVKMITSIDAAPGKDTTVFFSDGTRATVKSGNKLFDILTKPENVAPNMIHVTMQGKNIVDAEQIVLDSPSDEE